MTVTVTGKLARLRRQLKRQGITQDAIAAEAGVTRTYVVHFMAGRRKAPRVQAAIDRLLVAREPKAS